jgi:hypothetical protein
MGVVIFLAHSDASWHRKSTIDEIEQRVPAKAQRRKEESGQEERREYKRSRKSRGMHFVKFPARGGFASSFATLRLCGNLALDDLESH